MTKKVILTIAVVWCFATSSLAADLTRITLPPPDTKGGKPLMQCLSERRTNRSISPKKLPMAIISSLLWAACGINRPDSGKRTAPGAHNWQEVEAYVAMEEGLYRYNAKAHVLEPVLDRDLRAETTIFIQPSRRLVANAPVQLIYVADYSKFSFGMDNESKLLYSSADTGFIAQNVYLYCASAGLATVVRGYVEREKLAEAMKLNSDQKVVLVQTVGYPKE